MHDAWRVERSHLRALPKDLPDTDRRTEVRVARDGFIRVGGVDYSSMRRPWSGGARSISPGRSETWDVIIGCLVGDYSDAIFDVEVFASRRERLPAESQRPGVAESITTSTGTKPMRRPSTMR